MRQPSLFLKCHPRLKDGQEPRYWSICENRRSADGRRSQRRVFYWGEINDSQRAAWIKQIKVFDTDTGRASTMALFAEDRSAPNEAGPPVQIRPKEFELHRPRPWCGDSEAALD
jgi:hypothetical protein